MIDYDLFKSIENYARLHTESSAELYQARNENKDRIFYNILRGKIAEFCCYYSMKNAGYILEAPPDLVIYSQHKKSHNADLICIGKDDIFYDIKRYIHIKSVSRETYDKIGASFLVENNNPLIKNPKENHYYSLLLQHSLTHYTFIKWLCSTEARYEAPKNKNLTTKLAVYF